MTEFDEWKAEQAAKWLEHVRSLALDVARIQDRVDVLRSLAMPSGIDYSRPVVSSSPSADAIPNAVVKLMDAMREYLDQLDAYVYESMDAARRIEEIGDGRYRAVLSLYYVSGNTWEQVGEKLKKWDNGKFTYSPEYCRHLRNDALPFVYDVMPREWRTQIPRAD